MTALISRLQKNIDEKWDDCWPISSLKPLAILDLMSYIFFIKKLDDRDLINKKLRGIQGGNFVFTREVEDFTWSNLKDMDVQQVHDLFTSEHGFINLMTQYAYSNSLFSDYFKSPPILTPTPKLLSKVIDILNIIESNDTKTQAAIADYLFNKTNITGHNGQVFIPGNLAWLMAAIAEPGKGDIICDPSAGNGMLIVNADAYIANNGLASSKRFEVANAGGAVKAMESDLVQLRIAAMNMMLHGIKNPVVEVLELLPDGVTSLSEPPTLVISNLFLAEDEGNMRVEGDTLKTGKSGKEVMLLRLIMKSLADGGRAVVIVPEYLLNNVAPEFKNIRQDLVTHFDLEAVIYLPSGAHTFFSGAGILVFSKHEPGATHDVWFCKMKIPKENDPQANFIDEGFDDLPAYPGLHEVREILNQWKDRNASHDENSRNSFYISAYDIKDNNYNLSFNDYKLIRKHREPSRKDEPENPVVTTKKEHLSHFFEESEPDQTRKPRRRVLAAIILLLILSSGAAAGYFYYNRNNNFLAVDPGKFTVSGADTKTTGTGSQPQPVKNESISVDKNKTGQQAGIASSSKGYTVITKAFFYRTADSSKRKSLFLEPRKGLVLNPSEEKNGFIYVTYINTKGESTKGWLDKKDLQPLQ